MSELTDKTEQPLGEILDNLDLVKHNIDKVVIERTSSDADGEHKTKIVIERNNEAT